MRRLFISYARQNKADVDQLVEHLSLMGYETWVDSKLRGGEDWWEEILRRIANTDVFIAILSPASLNSTACRRECDWAEALERPMLPVAIEELPAALPRRFARRQIIDYSRADQRQLAALMLQGGLGTLPPAPPLPETLPEPPDAPLSYLTDLVDLVVQPGKIDPEEQHKVIHQLERALRSTDSEERRGGRDILERFSSRRDLDMDVTRDIVRLRGKTEQRDSASSSGMRSSPGQDISPPSAEAIAPAGRPWRRKPSLILGAILGVIALGGASTLAFAGEKPAEVRQRTLITGLTNPGGVAVGDDGTVYVADTGNNRVMKLAPGNNSQAEKIEAITGVMPDSVAVDHDATVYVCDGPKRVVLSLKKDAATPVTLHFDLANPAGVAVDKTGTKVYAADTDRNKVFLLAGNAQTELQYGALNSPHGVAVAKDGTVYVADTNHNRVVKLAAGSGPIELKFDQLRSPQGVAVSDDGTVYVADTDNHRVVKLGKGSPQTVLPITGLQTPLSVAVAKDGTVYVADTGIDAVVELLPG